MFPPYSTATGAGAGAASAAAAADDPWSNYQPSAAESEADQITNKEEPHSAIANGDLNQPSNQTKSSQKARRVDEDDEEASFAWSKPAAEAPSSELLDAVEQSSSSSKPIMNGSSLHANEQEEPNGDEEIQAQPAKGDDEEEEEDEEEFVYPGSESPAVAQDKQESEATSADVASVGPSEVPATTAAHDPSPASSTSAPARPIDFDRLATLCTSGPLSSLEKFFSVVSAPPPAGSGMSTFAIANETSPTTGLAPVHYAARSGALEILKWLVEQAGALVEMEDREGETALHKACLAGKLPIVTYLLRQGADPDAQDADGWTPLHNSCSQGYLDLVKVLIEQGKAEVNKAAGRGGWTPLMNAASKGHLPIVRYLTQKQGADPFARNKDGETAFDIAAATFEVYISEVLMRYEMDTWIKRKVDAAAASSSSMKLSAPYNPLQLHTTIPVILHENQRLDTRLSTLAMNGGKPRWSHQSSARATKPDKRAPGTMPPGPAGYAPSRTRNVPVWREDVGLPRRKELYKIRFDLDRAQHGPDAGDARRRKRGVLSNPEEEMSSTPTPESMLQRQQKQRAQQGSDDSAASSGAAASSEEEKSHFWLSDWQIDRTNPFVDVHTGWQYAQSFDAPEDKWYAEVPPPLQRLLEGKGLTASVTRALSGGQTPGPGVVSISAGSGGSNEEAVTTGWVRRRRWVRVMRRRLDLEFGDELEAAEVAGLEAALAGGSGSSVTAESVVADAHGSAKADAAKLGEGADYIAKAEAIAGSSAAAGTTPADAMGEGINELLKRITRLTLALEEIRANAFVDENPDRRAKAEDMLKEYTVQLGQLRQAAEFDAGSDDEVSDYGEDDDEEEFIYPNSYKDDGASVFTRIAPRTSSVPAAAGSSSALQVRPAIPQRQSSSASVFGAVVAPSEAGTSAAALRSADLAASREFRVPTRETSTVSSFATNGPRLIEQRLQPQWESDFDVKECRGCSRKFTFFLRKVRFRRVLSERNELTCFLPDSTTAAAADGSSATRAHHTAPSCHRGRSSLIPLCPRCF